jgi:hypothetical protein
MSNERKKPERERAELLADRKAAELHDEEARKHYPFLCDVLYPRFRDGVQTRVAGILTLTVENGAYRVTLRCEEEGLQTVAVLTTLSDLWTCLEAFLASEKAAWTLTYNAKKKLDTASRVD